MLENASYKMIGGFYIFFYFDDCYNDLKLESLNIIE